MRLRVWRTFLTLTTCALFSVAVVSCGRDSQSSNATRVDSTGSAVAVTPDSLGTSQAPLASCDSTGFATFWREFRVAALNVDAALIRPFVADTFAVRGPLDSDAWITVSSDAFAARWASLLQQDPGLSPNAETMREYIARSESLPAQAVDPSLTTARVADLVFQCASGRWQLSRAYSAD